MMRTVELVEVELRFESDQSKKTGKLRSLKEITTTGPVDVYMCSKEVGKVR